MKTRLLRGTCRFLAMLALAMTARADIVLLEPKPDATFNPPPPVLHMQWVWRDVRAVPKYDPLYTVTLRQLGPDGRTVGKPVILMERQLGCGAEIETEKLLTTGERWLWEIEAGAYMPFYGFKELGHISGVFDFSRHERVAGR